MSDDELDLAKGDPAYAEDSPAAQRRARRKSANEEKGKSSSSSRSSSRASSGDRIDAEVRTRLENAFTHIVEWREARGDQELAEIIREDGPAMAQGGVAFTRGIPALRTPLILFLDLLEPILAFHRVGRTLLIRVLYRRQLRAEKREQEQAQAQAEWEASQTAPMPSIG